MNSNYEILFLKALCVTVTVEAAVVIGCVLLIPGIKKKRLSVKKIAAACAIPSMLTLPYLWFILPAFFSHFLSRTVFGEIGIFLVEALILKIILDIPLIYVFSISLLANSLSIIAGLIAFQ